MLLTHVAERLRILPGMGWGLPNSPGHYLDLMSAIVGIVLLLAACIVRRRISYRTTTEIFQAHDPDHADTRP
jgi:hypothetical protein